MRRILSLAALLGLFGASQALAQTTANGTASITIEETLSITGTNVDPTFAVPTSSDFSAGFVASSTTASLATSGNVAHNVQIRESTGTATAMSATGAGARTDKPIGDFRWCTSSCTNGGAFTQLSTTSTDILAANLAAGDHTTTVNYRMQVSSASDTPGTYSVGFTYTVVAR